jgi:DNA repair exonuclease SbcCD ATPase subunit
MRARLVILAVLVIVGATGAAARAQSLGEAAAKEKERRAKVNGTAKTFTDADLQEAAAKRAKEGSSPGGAPSPSASPGAASPRPAASASPGAPSNVPEDTSATEAARKARGAEYKAQLEAVNAQLKQAEDELAAAEKDWRMVEDHRVALASRYDSAKERFETATRNVEALRHQRLDIEEAARREGIPPGYYLR